MTSRMTALTVAAALALTAVATAAEASGRGGKGSPHQWCHWYKQQAMSTGSEQWWWRWRKCIRGWYWD